MMKTALAVVKTHYSRLGAIQRLSAANSQASNQHFVVETACGLFFLKVIQKPDALYGGGGVARIRDIATAVADLGRAGLNVEHIEATDSAELTVDLDGSVYRMFRFIAGRGFSGKPADIKRAAAVLGTFHRLGAVSLRPATRRRVAGFRAPYPLDVTVKDMDAIQKFIETRLRLRLGTILREAAALCDGLTHTPSVLAHNDFHPGNVLFAKDGTPTIIDLDNIMIGPAAKCAAFAVLRFCVRRPADRVAGNLRRVLRLMASSYKTTSNLEFGQDLYSWMVSIELEKILRIAARVQKTRSYEQFLGNIALMHLPNLRFLMTNLL